MKDYYLAYRTDSVDYDEFDSFVCFVEDEKEVRELAKKMSGFTENNYVIVKHPIIDKGSYIDSRIICSSFNAG